MNDSVLFAEQVQRCLSKNAVNSSTNPSTVVKSPAQLAIEQKIHANLERRSMAVKAIEVKKQALKGKVTSTGMGRQKRKHDDDIEAAEKGVKREVTDGFEGRQI